MRPAQSTLTTLSSEKALDFACELLMPKGYTVSSRVPGLLIMTHREGPDLALGCLLLILGIVPGLIYLGLAGRTVSFTFTAREEGKATRFMWASDDRVLRIAVEQMLERLPKPYTTPKQPFDTRNH